MNYRHMFHAGNFADVFKHIILLALIKALQQKDKGCCFIDTHAGIGIYNLLSEAALRNPEYLAGIAPLLQIPNTQIPHAIINDYLNLVRCMQSSAAITMYPGSPAIMQQLLRPQDKLILNELHPEDYKTLKQNFSNTQTHCHNRDAYEFLPAILPATPKRGLILIDPPYENRNEFTSLLSLLPKAVKRFTNGVFLIWYPIVDNQHIQFVKNMLRLGFDNLICKELIIDKNPDKNTTGLKGAGVIIINAPYKIETIIEPATSWLEDFYINV